MFGGQREAPRLMDFAKLSDVGGLHIPHVITIFESGFLQQIQGGQQIDAENGNLLASLNLLEITIHVEAEYVSRALPNHRIVRRSRSCPPAVLHAPNTSDLRRDNAA